MTGRRRRNSETALMHAMLRLLALRGIRAERRNVAGCRPFTNAGTGRTYWVRLGRKGESDVTGTWPDDGTWAAGRRLELEVKAPGRRPTADQYAFLRAMERQGAVALWCDDIEMLDRWIGIIRSGYRPRIANDGYIDFHWFRLEKST